MYLILSILLSFSQPTLAADPNSPHPHQGVTERFSNPKPTVLSKEEQTTLENGTAVRRQVQGDSGGRGIAIMDVKASPDKIWKTILDYSKYPNWINDLEKTEIYGGTAEAGYHVEFELSVFGMEIIYYIDHDFHPDRGMLTWNLDYTRESDIDDSTGYWLVFPAPGRPGFTRVEYSVDLRLKGWVPGIVENMLAKKGLVLATSWVKQQAE
jgi:hypothetical protein